MGFLPAAIGAVGSLLGGGGKNSFQATPATGGAQFTEQNLLPAIQQAQGGFGTAQSRIGDVFGAQGALAQQLAAQSQGQGPNIAQLQLEQATNRNIQQGAGMLGSVRGMNPALAARLIAQQTAAANQQAAGQSGLMRAEQQLAAQNALANVYGQQGNLATAGGQLANQNLGVNQQALGQQNQQIVGAREAADKLNQQTAAENAKASAGALGGIGTALVGPLGNVIGDVGKSIGSAFQKKTTSSNIPSSEDYYKAYKNMAEGGPVLDPRGVDSLARAFGQKKVSDYKQGGQVPGEPKYPGNDERNDVVPAMLSKGEVVLPNSVTKAEDAPDKAKEFMKAIMKEKEPGPKGFSKILEAKRKMQEAMDHMDAVHKMMKKDNK